MHGGDHSYSLQPGMLFKKTVIKDIFQQPIWNYSQLLSYLWDKELFINQPYCYYQYYKLKENENDAYS